MKNLYYYGVKNLTKLRKKYNLDEVLIVDDVDLTAVNNYGNLVHIKPFIYDRKDDELFKLKNYLEKIKDAIYIRAINLTNTMNKNGILMNLEILPKMWVVTDCSFFL